MIPGRTKAVQGCQKNGKAIIIAGEGAAAGAATAAILKELGFKKRIRQIEKDKVTSKLKCNTLQKSKLYNCLQYSNGVLYPSELRSLSSTSFPP